MTPTTPRRGLTVRSAAISEANGVPSLEPLELEGEEGVNALFEYRLVLQHLPGDAPQTWVSQPYALYKNKALVAHGVTDDTGHITIDEVDPGAAYAVEIGQGLRFAIPVAERFATPADLGKHLEQRLSSQGVRADGAGTASRKEQAARDQRA